MAEITTEQIEKELDNWNLPDATKIVTPKVNNFFSANSETQPGLDDEPVEEAEEGQANTDATSADDAAAKAAKADEFLNKFDQGTEDEAALAAGKVKTDKSLMVEFLKEEIEAGNMEVYDDWDETKQTLDEYLTSLPLKDLKTLAKENYASKETKANEEAPIKLLAMLPKELQAAAKYAIEGGQDLQGMFNVLGRVEAVNKLDPGNDDDQVSIVRNYLQAKKVYKTADKLEAQITEWIDLGKIGEKASEFKPELLDMQKEIAQNKVREAELANRQRQAAFKNYTENVHKALQPGNLGGIPLTKKEQEDLYLGLTRLDKQAMNGQPTNEWGYLLEKYQFGPEADYSVVAELLLHARDPKAYREKILQVGANAGTATAVRKLKTKQGDSASAIDTAVQDDAVRTTTKKSTLQRNRPSFFAPITK